MSKAQIQRLIDTAPSSWLKMFKRYKLGRKPTVNQLIETVLEYTPTMRSSGARGTAKHKVPKAVKKEAMKGLLLAHKHNWTSASGVGLVRAMQLVVRPKIWDRSVERMNSYFTRHARDKESNAIKSGKQTWGPRKPSRGYIAHLAWGGDSGQKWASRQVMKTNPIVSKRTLTNPKNSFALEHDRTREKLGLTMLRKKPLTQKESQIVQVVQDAIANDLPKECKQTKEREEMYAKQRKTQPLAGRCSLATQAVWKLLGGLNKGNPKYVPLVIRAGEMGKNSDTHWFIIRLSDGKIIDPTSSQFGRKRIPYEKGQYDLGLLSQHLRKSNGTSQLMKEQGIWTPPLGTRKLLERIKLKRNPMDKIQFGTIGRKKLFYSSDIEQNEEGALQLTIGIWLGQDLSGVFELIFKTWQQSYYDSNCQELMDALERRYDVLQNAPVVHFKFSELSDDNLKGRGIGQEVYKIAASAAWNYLQQPFYLASDKCEGGSTSTAAGRVWKALRNTFPMASYGRQSDRESMWGFSVFGIVEEPTWDRTIRPFRKKRRKNPFLSSRTITLVPKEQVRMVGFTDYKTREVQKEIPYVLGFIEEMRGEEMLFPTPIRAMTDAEFSRGRNTVDNGHPMGAGHGQINMNTNEIAINPRMGVKDLVANVFHENLHYAFPDWPEESVRDMTGEAMLNLYGEYILGRPFAEERRRNPSPFVSDLMTQFIDTGEVHEGTPILAQTFPNNCRVEFVIDRYDNTALLVYIQTIGKDCLRKGYAKATMENILRVVDKHQLRTELSLEPFGNMSQNALSKFYSSLGFDFTGEYDNFDAPIMLRSNPRRRRNRKGGTRDSKGRFIPARYLSGYKGNKLKARIAEIEQRRDEYQAALDKYGDEDQFTQKVLRKLYRPFKTDKGVKSKRSKYTQEAKKRGFVGSVDEKAKLASKYYGGFIDPEILDEVNARGKAAWVSGGHRGGQTPFSWGIARVNSFLVGGKTFWTSDADLVRQLPKNVALAIAENSILSPTLAVILT